MPTDANGSYVSQSDAITAWMPVAHDALVKTAHRYNGLIRYKELSELVQGASGITTNQRLDYWIGGLLENVAIEAARRGEPPLTALCVHQDGTIGEGYRRAPKSVPSDPNADVEQLAAEHRLLCYRRYATDLPPDGGKPTLTSQVAKKRAWQKRMDPQPRPTCPIHHLELSATGVCALCE